jgi:hypothetical protein
MKFTKSESPITLEDIEAIQSDLGIRFPPGLRDEYLGTNGGIPDPYVSMRTMV